MAVAIWDKTRGFIDNVVKELKRVSWPSPDEVKGTTLVVVVTVLIVSAYLGVVDMVLGAVTRYIFGIGRS